MMDETPLTSLHGRKRRRDVSSRSMSEGDLRPFADQLIAIAEQLRSGEFARTPSETGRERLPSENSADQAIETTPTFQKPDKDERQRVFVEMARQTYARRRSRDAIFGNPELFGEPAWDILLDLFIAHFEGKSVSVSSACIGSASPPTTGLRWLGVLSEQELIQREHDPQDQRRVLVRLSSKGVAAMERYFSGAGAST